MASDLGGARTAREDCGDAGARSMQIMRIAQKYISKHAETPSADTARMPDPAPARSTCYGGASSLYIKKSKSGKHAFNPQKQKVARWLAQDARRGACRSTAWPNEHPVPNSDPDGDGAPHLHTHVEPMHAY